MTSGPASGAGSPAPIAVVGVHGGQVYGHAALAALAGADLVAGSRRHLSSTAALRAASAETLALDGPLEGPLDQLCTASSAGRATCLLASGDPGFFGIVRALAARAGSDRLRVHPAPSSVSLAFARLGLSWDDALVVSAHGRPLAAAVGAVRAGHAPSVAVLTSPENPPQAVAKALLAAGEPAGVTAAVASQLGEAGEAVTVSDLAAVAAGEFDPLSVLVLADRSARAGAPTLAWGLPETEFDHRDGMITKAEVRAIALGKLELPVAGVLWDLGAGSGSVAIECARLRSGLEVVAVERDPAQVARIRSNAARHDVAVAAIEGSAPAVLAGLPDPDRVFVGGGGIGVLEAALGRLRPGGVLVATYALVDRAAAAAARLGNVVQVSVNRGVPAGQLGLRLQAENPVFVCWGSAPGEPAR